MDINRIQPHNMTTYIMYSNILYYIGLYYAVTYWSKKLTEVENYRVPTHYTHPQTQNKVNIKNTHLCKINTFIAPLRI